MSRNFYEHRNSITSHHRSSQYGPSAQNSQNKTLFLHVQNYYRKKNWGKRMFIIYDTGVTVVQTLYKIASL